MDLWWRASKTVHKKCLAQAWHMSVLLFGIHLIINAAMVPETAEIACLWAGPPGHCCPVAVCAVMEMFGSAVPDSSHSPHVPVDHL